MARASRVHGDRRRWVPVEAAPLSPLRDKYRRTRWSATRRERDKSCGRYFGRGRREVGETRATHARSRCDDIAAASRRPPACRYVQDEHEYNRAFDADMCHIRNKIRL